MAGMASFTFQDRILLRYYGWRKRWRAPSVFSLPDALRQTGRLLLCLPDEPGEAALALTVLPDLMDCLGAESVMVIGPAQATGLVDDSRYTVEVAPIGPADRHWTGFPKPETARRIAHGRIGLALDLNSALNPLIAALCARSGAPVRICFEGPHRDLFFNLQIAMTPDPEDATDMPPDRQNSSGNRYTRLLNTLRRLAGQPLNPA